MIVSLILCLSTLSRTDVLFRPPQSSQQIERMSLTILTTHNWHHTGQRDAVTITKEINLINAAKTTPIIAFVVVIVTFPALQRRHNDRGNNERRDDGERHDGWNQLDVDTNVAYPRPRCIARLGHFREEGVTGPLVLIKP